MPPSGFAPGAARPAGAGSRRSGIGERGTHTFLVPADLAAVLAAVQDGRVRIPGSLRQVLLGAAPVLPPLLRRAAAVLPGVEFLAAYGMTEILPRPPGSRPGVDDAGRLVVGGANLPRGYLGDPPSAGPRKHLRVISRESRTAGSSSPDGPPK